MDIQPFTAKECASCTIRHNTLCAKCGDDELEILSAMKFFRSYEAGQNVVWAGDRMDFVGSIASGVAAMSQTMEDGRTQMVGLLLENDFLGHPGRERAPYDVVATTDLVMCCFRKKPFERLITETPHIAQRLLEITLNELDAAREWMLLLGRKTAREKIASLIAIIARRNRKAVENMLNGPIVFDLPLTRVAMADYLGLTLETVSRQISKLRKEGIIQIEGKRRITIPDYHRLVVESGDDVTGIC
ncbi:MAG: transcriptional regulator [Rhodobacterales bacterium]|nr:MAG: transcriptional regulator [Rhodobacterales bacterium]